MTRPPTDPPTSACDEHGPERPRRRRGPSLAVRRTTVLGLVALGLLGGTTGALAGSPARPAAGGGTPCLGAAARDPAQQPCVNPALTLAVMPTPSDAELETGDGCQEAERADHSWMCSFGSDPPTRTFALVGDSHAGHWRPAMGPAAAAFRWGGVSITRAGCPYSAAVPYLAPDLRSQCVAWTGMVRGWLTAHPEVGIVFFSDHAGARVLGPTNLVLTGRAAFEAKVAGYIAAWNGLPPSVQHIIVIRDTPLNMTTSFGCVDRAIVRRQQAGPVCAVPRSFALKPDPEVTAAIRLRSPRIQVIDLTQFFCDRRVCYPVIGGVLVHKDTDHLTTEFSASLGPFFLRKVEALTSLPNWGSATTYRAGGA